MKTVITILSLCGLLLCGSVAKAEPFSAMEIEPLSERVKAPALKLAGLDGIEKTLADYEGKVVLLNFWATWCAPCLREMPDMERLWQKYRDSDFVVVGISNDQSRYKKRVATFIRKVNLTFPILLDSNSDVSERYEVAGIPVSFLIARDGTVVARIVGEREWGSAEAFELVDYLLQQS